MMKTPMIDVFGWVAEWTQGGSLENCCGRKSTGGSNPSPSASLAKKFNPPITQIFADWKIHSD